MAAANLLEALNNDEMIEVIPVGEGLYRDGLQLIETGPIKSGALRIAFHFS